MIEKKCKNCEKSWAIKWTRGYCEQCYPIILKIKKLEKDEWQSYNSTFFSEEENKAMRSEHIRQLKSRLSDIYDAKNLLDSVTAHELEYKINSTLKQISCDGNLKKYGLGKINDYLGSSSLPTKELMERNIFIYNLFSKIKVQKRFKRDLFKIYDAIKDVKK